MSDLSTHLDTVLDIMPWSESAGQVRKTINAIEMAKRELNILEARLRENCRRIIGDLALNLKKEVPALNLAVVASECKVGNRSKVVKAHIDTTERKWVITTESSGLQGRFYRPPITVDITNDLSEVIKVISDQFSDKDGDGKILVEGKISSTTRLAEWAMPRLNSRLSRMSK